MTGLPRAEALRIYVRQRYQGLGLRRILIDQAIMVAGETGKRYIWLWGLGEK